MFVVINDNIEALKVLNNNSGAEEITNEDIPSKLYEGLKLIREMALKNDNRLGLIKLRDQESPKTFRAFVYFFLQHMINRKEWGYSKTRTRFGRLFTIWDEAFVLLLMINNWDRFEDKAKIGYIRNSPKKNTRGKVTKCKIIKLQYCINQ